MKFANLIAIRHAMRSAATKKIANFNDIRRADS
jgi:hypothetical protein